MMEIPRSSVISKNPKLQEDIERNLKLRDGALRILAVAANTIQRLDAAKTIIVSNSRLVVSMQQLQREKTNEANAAASTVGHGDRGLCPPATSSRNFCTGKATLCLSGIRIPLLWKDTSLTPNASSALNRLLDPSYHWSSGTSNSYSSSTVSRQQRPLSAVLSMATVGALAGGEALSEVCSAFCIIRVGDQIRETRLLCEVYPGSADLEFDDVLTFENVQPDFECNIEIYGYQSSNGQGGTSFLRRKSQMDSTSAANRNSVFLGTLTPEYAKDSKTGQRISISSNSPATDCCFTLVARYSANLADLGEKVNAHPLELLSSHSHGSSVYPSSSANFPFSSASTLPTSEDVLPLFGPICFALTALPYSVQKPVLSGLLWLRTLNVSSEPEAAKLYSCELCNQILYARLIKPDERTMSSLKCDRGSADESMSEVRLRGSPSKAVSKPPNKWDIQLKVDPSTEILDNKPVCRSMPLSLKALTWEEREHLLSKPQRLLRRFFSADPLLSLSAPDEETTGNVKDGGSDYKKGDFCNLVARIRSLEEIQLTTSAFFERPMETLRIVSRLCGGDEKVVVEVAAFDPRFSTTASELEDSVLLSNWLFAMREHIEEQAKWGVGAFGHEIYIPEATSLTKHGTVIRASTIPDIPAASLEALSSPITEEASAPPITVL